MRSYIRHPLDMPIEIQASNPQPSGPDLRDIGHGGLSFRYSRPVPVGATIRIRIAVTNPVFEAVCRVAWCEEEGDSYRVGVEFLDQADRYRARMVEQVCQIEEYRRDMQAKHGRVLTAQEAAFEWISKFAKSFPRFGT